MTAEQTCSACGAPLAPDMQFCPACGMPVAAETDDSALPVLRRPVSRRIVAAAIILALVFGSVAGILVVVTRDNGYPREAEQGFLAGCVRNGTALPTCRCVLTEMEKRFTYREFLAVSDEYARTGRLPIRAFDAVRACGPGQTPA